MVVIVEHLKAMSARESPAKRNARLKQEETDAKTRRCTQIEARRGSDVGSDGGGGVVGAVETSHPARPVQGYGVRFSTETYTR